LGPNNFVSQLLRDHIEAISPLSDDEFDYILSHFISKKIRKHAYLIQEGDYVKHEYFVLNGCLKAFVADSNTGKDFIFQFAVEDWWITDREAFFTRSRSTINVDCLEDCEVLGITLDNREKLASEMRKYEHFLAVKANWGYISLQKRLQLMIMGSAKERYERFTRQYPHLADRIPKSFIASYLGVSRETLSRLRRS
jgi:CRP-like cAMP-binding protein